MAGPTYDVFLSYRRDTGSELAQLVRTHLERRGFRVFLDVRELGAGHFDDALLTRIEEAPDFVLILGPHSLDRCRQEGDWVRREIGHAIASGRNVVPLAMPEFRFPDPSELPAELATLPRHQAIVYEHRYSDEALGKLVGMLQSAGAVRRRLARRRFLTWAAVPLVAVAAFWGLGTRLPGWRWPGGSLLEPLAVYWHGFGQRPDADRWTEFIVQDGATMYSGDQFRIVFSPSADAYAYVVSIDSRQQVAVLFPHEAIGMDNHVRAGERYEVPDGLNWFTLDERTGTETLYVVASYDPIQDLDALFTPRAGASPDRPAAAQVEARLSSLDGLRQGSEPIATGRGRVAVRGVEIRPDRRVAAVTLTGGQQVSREMQFEAGGSRVVKRILIRHEARPK
jgi:hypothetical protein